MIQEKHIEDAIRDLFGNLKFTAEPSGLYDPLRYMMEIGGKRIRPRLCLIAYSLFKDTLSEEILSPAAAMVYFFTGISSGMNRPPCTDRAMKCSYRPVTVSYQSEKATRVSVLRR